MRVHIARLTWLTVLAFALLAVACSGGDDAPEGEAGASATSTGNASDVLASGSDATGTATAPEWVEDALEEQEALRYIANTGGVGVSHRSACETGARLEGVWPEGTELQIVLESEPNCEDWSLLSDGEITSWVANKYLSLTAPVSRSSSSGSSSGTIGSSGGSTGGSTQVEVINFFGNLIPTAQLLKKPATYNYNNGVLISGCAESWHPIGDSAIAVSGKIIADPDPSGCGFGTVALVPPYWIATSS